MKVKELIEQLSQINPEAEVYLEADHGQLPECGTIGIAVSFVNGEFPHYGDNLLWHYELPNHKLDKADAVLLQV